MTGDGCINSMGDSFTMYTWMSKSHVVHFKYFTVL